MIKFLQPGMAWWLPALLIIAALARWRLQRRFAASTMVALLSSREFRPSPLRKLPLAWLALSLALLTGGLMQPVIPYSQAEVRSQGLDIVMLMDLSSSMQEEIGLTPDQRATTSSVPVGRTRLQATKDAIKAFVRSRRDDRIGLVVFSDNPYVISPLTFDHDSLLRYVDFVDDQILQGEGQTAIGDGLALANYMLARQPGSAGRGHQVVVLFTDGEYNRGRDPVEVLAESKDAEIRVHVIGVDLEQDVKAKQAVQQLVQTVRANGGRYFDASSERDLGAASRTIDEIEKSMLVSRVYVHDVPVYEWFTIPALIMLALTIVTSAVPYFVDQT